MKTSGLTFDKMMISLLFLAIAATACLMPTQADSYWHLRAGADIWRTHHVPLTESYSYTAAGAFWPNHEWLWQAFSYALFRVGGMPLLVGGAAAIVTTSFALAYRLMVGAPATRLVLMIVGVPICACVWALRPQIVSLALLALLVSLLANERTRWLPPLFVLWANVHGAVALGGAVLVGAAILSVVDARRGSPADRRRAVTLAILTPVCGAATALTPMGTGLWSFIVESMARSRQTMINEWMPAYPRGPVEIAFLVLALAFVVLLVRRWRSLSGWSDRVVVIAAVVVLPLAFRAVRNIPPFLLLAMPAASRLLGPDFRLRRRAAQDDKDTQDNPSPDHPRINLAMLIGFATLATAAIAVVWSLPLPMLGWRPFAPGVIAALRACPGPLYNRYGDGGYVIWFVPEIPVFVDSRQDPYPVSFVIDAVRADSHSEVDDLFARHGIRCALLSDDSKTLPRLRQRGWRPSFADDEWSVLVPPDVRDETPPRAAPSPGPAGSPARP